MLFKILDNIRSKPKHVRDQYALGLAIACTFVIGGVWSLSLPARFAGNSNVAALASSTNAAPFANFFTQFKNQFSGFKQAVNELPRATTTPSGFASTTEAALDLQLSSETKAQIQASSTATKIEFGTTSTSTIGTARPVLVGTTTIQAKPTR